MLLLRHFLFTPRVIEWKRNPDGSFQYPEPDRKGLKNPQAQGIPIPFAYFTGWLLTHDSDGHIKEERHWLIDRCALFIFYFLLFIVVINLHTFLAVA